MVEVIVMALAVIVFGGPFFLALRKQPNINDMPEEYMEDESNGT